MTGPPSTLRTHAQHSDPAHQSLDEDVSPTLQQLIRLQIFTPLTLLLALGAQLVTIFAVRPNIGEISDEYETIWTPWKEFIGGYLLFVGPKFTQRFRPLADKYFLDVRAANLLLPRHHSIEKPCDSRNGH